MAGAVDSVKVKYKLNNGNEMPAVGMRTFRIHAPNDVMEAVDRALSAGYRMFDTAPVYRNEKHVKEAFRILLPRHDLERDDIFITMKLSPSDHGKLNVVKRAYINSFTNLGMHYADLYLIDFPETEKFAFDDKRNTKIRHATWESMVKLYEVGLVDAIGVSNFNKYHLELLMKRNHGVVPAVNQVEWHPFYFQTELLQYCKANDILLQAYCSLGGKSINDEKLLRHPSVTKIAQSLGVTNAQVLLRWALQQDISIIIPKSTNPLHIKDNISLNFEMSAEDISILNELSENKVKYAWDPSTVV